MYHDYGGENGNAMQKYRGWIIGGVALLVILVLVWLWWTYTNGEENDKE
jgi:hypothetical protein